MIILDTIFVQSKAQLVMQVNFYFSLLVLTLGYMNAGER